MSLQFLEVLTSTELYKLSVWEQLRLKHSKVGEIQGAGQNLVEDSTGIWDYDEFFHFLVGTF